MDFFKRNWGLWLTLAIFVGLTVLNIENLWLSLLVFIFVFPFTKRGFIAKALFFLDFIYLILLVLLVLLSLLMPDAPFFQDALYIGLVVTIWSWLCSFLLAEIMDDNDADKTRIIYLVGLIAAPIASSILCSVLGGTFRTILCWVVGLVLLSTLVAIFNVSRTAGDASSSSGRKTPSLFLVERAARSAARECHCEVVSVQKNGGKIVVILANARDSYGWSDVSNHFMQSMAQGLEGFDLHDIQIAY